MTGLRNPKNDFRAELMDPIEKLQPEFMRYKFLRGNWTWEDGIGPMSGRKDDKARQKIMGIDEAMAFQMRVVKDAGRCQLVVNPCDPEQCAALVAVGNFVAEQLRNEAALAFERSVWHAATPIRLCAAAWRHACLSSTPTVIHRLEHALCMREWCAASVRF